MRNKTRQATGSNPLKNPKVIGITVAVLALVVVIWGVRSLWAARAIAKEVAKVKDLRSEAFSEQSRQLPREEREAKMKEFFEAARNLPDAQRDQLRKEGMEMVMKRMKERMDTFFKADPKEQRAMLDEEIRADEKRRKDWEARRKQGGDEGRGRGGNGGPGAGGNGGPGAGGNGGPGAGGWSGGNRGPGGVGGGAGGGNANAAGANSANRADSRGGRSSDERRRQFLDATTPEARAQFSEYRRMMNERRQQLGLPPSTGFGGFPRGGGMPRGGGAPKGGV